MLSSASGEARSSDTAKQTGYETEKIGWLCRTQNRTNVRWSQSILEKLNLCVSLSAVWPADYRTSSQVCMTKQNMAKMQQTWKQCESTETKEKSTIQSFFSALFMMAANVGERAGSEHSGVKARPFPRSVLFNTSHHLTLWPPQADTPWPNTHVKETLLAKTNHPEGTPTRSFLSAQGLCVIFFLWCK